MSESPCAGRWPLHPQPRSYDTLERYVRRLAECYGARYEYFCLRALGIPLADSRARWFAEPASEVLQRLSAGTGIPVGHLILSSPALRLRLPAFAGELLAYASFLVPRLVVDRGSWLRRISHDPSVLAAAESDPLNHRKITARLLYSMFPAMKQVRRDAANRQADAVAGGGGRPRRRSEEEPRFLPEAPRTRRHAALVR